jgi:endo-1,4-beta-D-glucanase Y
MGFALVMADKQWGGYATVAKAFLGTMAKGDFETDGTIKGGDKYPNAVDPSYLAPAYYRTFATYTGDATWTTILEKSYSLLQAATNSTTGLVPDWSVPAGRGPDYKYDAARTPFRIALDACWNNEPRAVTFSTGIAKFFAGIGAVNIKDGYNVSSGMSISTNVNSTFVGPAGVAAMAGNQPQLVGDAYAFVADAANKGTDSYYNLGWALFSTLMMTGNFADLTLQ